MAYAVDCHVGNMISHNKHLLVACLLAIAICYLLPACDRNVSPNPLTVVPPPGTPGQAFVVSPGLPRTGEVRVGAVIKGGVRLVSVEWYVSTNVLASQPKWDGLSQELPMSARRACEIALPHVREKFPQVQSWVVDRVNLRNLFDGEGVGTYSFPNVWCYQIAFSPSDPDQKAKIEKDGLGYAMTQTVLLDGTVVTPIVTVK
jgi:hypothetical protein